MLTFLKSLWDNKVVRGAIFGIFLISSAFFLYKAQINSAVTQKLAQQTIEQLEENAKNSERLFKMQEAIIKSQEEIHKSLQESTKSNLEFLEQQQEAIINEPSSSKKSSRVLRDTVKALEERFK